MTADALWLCTSIESERKGELPPYSVRHPPRSIKAARRDCCCCNDGGCGGGQLIGQFHFLTFKIQTFSFSKRRKA